MTQSTAKKVATLTSNTTKYMSKVTPKKGGNMFAVSAAKYYPALKKLASE